MPPIADRRNAIATLAAIAETRPPHPEHGAFLTDPIGRMLDPDPASRWSMADAAHALRRLNERHRPAGTLAMTGDVEPVPPAAPVATGTADRRYAARHSDVSAAPERDRRSRLPLLAGALLLLLLTGIVGAVLLDRGRSRPVVEHRLGRNPLPRRSRPRRAPPRPRRPRSHPDRVIVLDRDTADVGQAARRGRVADYYALLPGNTRRAWEMLGEDAQAQAGGYDSYVGFWRTIGDVSVDAVSADGDVVTAQLTYTTDRGQENETRQFEVERTGDDWLITEDLGPVSS